MESLLKDPAFVELDKDSQRLIVMGKKFSLAFDAMIHYLFLPFVFTYSFCAYAPKQSWKITKHILSELYELTKIVPLSFETYFWSMRCFLGSVFVSKSKEERAIEVEQKIYKPLKKILRLLHALPFSYSHATSLYTILNQLPVFGEGRIPFPNFLFEDTFKKVDFEKGTVSIVLAPPEDTPQSPIETLTSSETPATIEESNSESAIAVEESDSETAIAVEESKPANFETKPIKSKDRVQFDLPDLPDLPPNQRPTARWF